MKIPMLLKRWLSRQASREELNSLPEPLQEFEKNFIKTTQEELKRTLQILEIEAEVVTRK